MNTGPTNELLYKNIFGFTREAIDCLFDMDLITEEEHSAGIMLRILRSEKFGAPHIHANDNSHNGGREICKLETSKTSSNQKIYNKAIKGLTNIGSVNITLEVCVYDKLPTKPEQLFKLHQGLNFLVDLFNQEYFGNYR